MLQLEEKNKENVIREIYFSMCYFLFFLFFSTFMGLRSNFNSRGVNSRELFWFFGHNSLPYHAIWTKIGGMKAVSVPDLSITSKSTKNLKKHKKKHVFKTLVSIFLRFLTFLVDLEVIERSGRLIAFIPPIFVQIAR